MTLRNLTIVPLLALALFSAGCGNDCESTCEDIEECNDGDASDCADECESGQKEAERTGCEDERDAYFACVGDLDDICKYDPKDDCTKEAGAYGECSDNTDRPIPPPPVPM